MTDKPRVNQLEKYLNELIKHEVDKREFALKDTEMKFIVSELNDAIDKIVARRVKEHFIQLAEFIQAKFTEEND